MKSLPPVNYQGPLSEVGITGKKMGLWDYILFEIGITETSFAIGIMGLKINQIWIFHPCIFGMLNFTRFDYAGFEIGITGLQDPPFWGPNYHSHVYL